jgi:hypothetical protein
LDYGAAIRATKAIGRFFNRKQGRSSTADRPGQWPQITQIAQIHYFVLRWKVRVDADSESSVLLLATFQASGFKPVFIS